MSLDKNLFQQPSNKLLAALPASDYERLVPHLKLVTLPVGQILYEAGEPITQVYFPDKSMVSIVTTMEDGSMAEVGVVGNEGMVGIPVILGDKTTTTRAFVQISGAEMQMDADVLQAEFNRGGAIQTLLLCYLQAVYTELAQGMIYTAPSR
ncbi:Crp/Fnr family transcriptional regulator [Nostoc sp. NMS7]|uniref:Crp/Fnr family transcriptional regulator n=1 Tax=Nostoc sp. NMS7 TaxID=2815391 RepID=UPI0025D114C5|nr:Crp/Fnr family transcriptional regulator [Nostoc sp. NMS7]